MGDSLMPLPKEFDILDIDHTATESRYFRIVNRNRVTNRALVGYRIFRAKIEDLHNENAWTPIAENETQTEYSDPTWSAVADGAYRYIIKALYTNDILSRPGYSNVISKNMTSEVTINITTEDDASVAGAIVRLENHNGLPEYIYQQTATGNNVVLNDVWYGSYTLTVSLTEYETYINENLTINTDKLTYDIELEISPTIFFEGFEGETFPPAGWTLIDNDGDGKGWVRVSSNTHSVNSGRFAILSESWNNEALFPDNYIITPAITLRGGEDATAELNWYVAAQESGYEAEHYSVLISTNDSTLDDFMPIHSETLTSTNWLARKVNISEFAGQTVFLAFRHHNSSDKFQIKIDDIEVISIAGTTNEADENLPPFITSLNGNYPNPFNPSTMISFDIGNHDSPHIHGGGKGGDIHISIDIYNIRGQRVRRLVNEPYAVGSHSVEWNGTDDNGRNVASGIYFYQMRTDEYTATRRMVLLK